MVEVYLRLRHVGAARLRLKIRGKASTMQAYYISIQSLRTARNGCLPASNPTMRTQTLAGKTTHNVPKGLGWIAAHELFLVQQSAKYFEDPSLLSYANLPFQAYFSTS